MKLSLAFSSWFSKTQSRPKKGKDTPPLKRLAAFFVRWCKAKITVAQQKGREEKRLFVTTTESFT